MAWLWRMANCDTRAPGGIMGRLPGAYRCMPSGCCIRGDAELAPPHPRSHGDAAPHCCASSAAPPTAPTPPGACCSALSGPGMSPAVALGPPYAAPARPSEGTDGTLLAIMLPRCARPPAAASTCPAGPGRWPA